MRVEDFLIVHKILSIDQLIKFWIGGNIFGRGVLDTDGLVTYNDLDWHLVKCKFGKYITRFYKFDPGTVTHLCEKVKSILETPQTFKILEGDELKEAYYRIHYFPNHGTLSNSCMRYKKCQDKDFFKLYGDNAKMLVMVPNKGCRLLGRAILWEYNGIILMDRVYSTAPYIENQFYNYAKSKGWFILKRNTFTYGGNGAIQRWLNPKSGYQKECLVKINIQLKEKCNCFPFVDSICYLNKDKDQISTIPFLDGYVLQTTSGGLYEYKNNN